MEEIKFTIDGREVRAKAGQSVLEAALNAGIYIPNLCWDSKLEPYGGCRLCVVEIEGMRGLPTACTTKVAAGMKVRSETPEVHQVRKITMELLVADHPLECLTCSLNQRCDLQRAAAYLGVEGSRLRRSERAMPADDSNPFFVRDFRKCILCARCVRVCQEVRGLGAIDLTKRGYEALVSPFAGLPIADSICESCGECVDHCPTGALFVRGEAILPAQEVKTICPYCGVGCQMILGVRQNRIVKVTGDPDYPVNQGSLCVKGRFGLGFVSSADRLKTPLIKKNGKFVEASWEEALDLVAAKFQEVKEKHGPEALAGLCSAKATNEENYLFQKFIRAALGSPHVDHCARLCHASTVAGLAASFGSGAMTNSIPEFDHADTVLIIGSNTTETHPVIGVKLRRAALFKGAKLIVADPRRIDLAGVAAIHMRQRSGTDVALVNAMMNVILAEGLEDKQFIAERTEGLADALPAIQEMTPERAEQITGVPADRIRQAARMFAAAARASIVYAMGITQHSHGTDNVKALANLALLTGNLGKPGTGVNPLRGQNNVQGACDMGGLPNVLPGYKPVTDEAARKGFEAAWGVPLPDRPGLTVVEMLNAVEQGEIQALYIMGENPALSDPNLNHTRHALEKCGFLVVQDIFLTETAELADVVLPGASFAEKDGTFTNTERRVARVRQALALPGQARQDWRIIQDLSNRLGYPMSYESPKQILEEINRLVPQYAGITWERLDQGGIHWPCPDAAHPGTPILHKEKFTRGKGKFFSTPFVESVELPDKKYPLLLTTGRQLYHYHTSTMTGKVEGLEELCPGGTVEINPADAARLGIADGEKVEVASRRGKVEAVAMVTDRVPAGTIFMPFHFAIAPANLLTNDALDPTAKIPELKVCAAVVRKVA